MVHGVGWALCMMHVKVWEVSRLDMPALHSPLTPFISFRSLNHISTVWRSDGGHFSTMIHLSWPPTKPFCNILFLGSQYREPQSPLYQPRLFSCPLPVVAQECPLYMVLTFYKNGWGKDPIMALSLFFLFLCK